MYFEFGISVKWTKFSSPEIARQLKDQPHETERGNPILQFWP